jgi:hypothetical protein
VVHAHPFRQHFYIRKVCLVPRLIDGVEAANAGNRDRSYDALAARYAAGLGLPMTAGSDIHDVGQVLGGDLFGVYLERRLESGGDFAALIRDGGLRDTGALKVTAGRLKSRGGERISLPLEILDEGERRVSGDLWGFLERG